MLRRWLSLFALVALIACGPPEGPKHTEPTARPSASAPLDGRPVTISVVGTNDLHGRVLALPLLGGFVDNLRRVRAADGGGVLLVDAGDMFQGTLESNLLEGAPVRDAYAALGYAAVAIGNHEFDFGPAGAPPTPQSPGDDPRGALKALAGGAPFPFLVANLHEKASGRPVAWDNVRASVLVEVAGVKLGIIGITTEDTLQTTIASNVSDLAMAPALDAVLREGKTLRGAGARAVIVLAHAGGRCKTFTNDVTADLCESEQEIFRLAAALPKGAVDAIVAGHTHAGVAHEVHGIPVIEQFAYGRAFGRVDLTFAGAPAKLVERRLFPPRDLCPGQPKPDFAACDPGAYEGAPVKRAAKIEAAIATGVTAAQERRAKPVGVTLAAAVERSHHAESPLGNLFADLILEAAPGADVALMNGGGLREDLPAGDLAYGALFEAFPFDNLIATAHIEAGDFERLLADHLAQGEGGILSIAGMTVRARCKGDTLEVELVRTKSNEPVRDDERLLLAASDFMLLGGDSFWGPLSPPPIDIKSDLMRDALERGLARRKALAPTDVLDPKRPRLDLATPRPLRCGPR